MSLFQNILALDTALAGCSAAVLAGERGFVRSEVMARGQAEQLVPFAQDVVHQAGLSFEALDGVICTVGPGAFTGLRIGISAAKAFGLSLGIPVFGITSLQALALNFTAKHASACSVVIETKRADFYVQSFDCNARASAPAIACAPEDIAVQGMLIGDGAVRFMDEGGYGGAVDLGFDLPDLVQVCQIFKGECARAVLFAEDVQPIYLRGADVSQPKAAPRILEERLK